MAHQSIRASERRRKFFLITLNVALLCVRRACPSVLETTHLPAFSHIAISGVYSGWSKATSTLVALDVLAFHPH